MIHPMLVSVIIPAYNRKELLQRAVQSVQDQTYKNFELIVVDDGSTDGTEGTYRQPHQGVSAARNLGIRKSRGGLIAFLDSDDAWAPQKLQRQVRFFQDHPDARICQTEEIWIRNGRRVNPMKKHKKYSGMIFRQCLPLCIVSPSAVMMRRELFDQIGLFDESLPACEDYDLWLRVACRFPIYLIEEPLTIKYGGHSDQLSRTVPALDKYRIQSMLKLLDSGILTSEQKQWTLEELKKKSKIYADGCLKHGRTEEAGRVLSS